MSLHPRPRLVPFAVFAGVLVVTLACTLATRSALDAQRVESPPATVGVQFPVDPEVPFWACFAAGTPQDYVEQWYTAGAIRPGLLPEDAGEPGSEYYLGGSWNSQGAPVNLTWSFVPEGFNFGGGAGGSGSNTLFSTLDGQFGGDTATWINRFENSFERWSYLTGINYTRVTSGGNEWDDGASWGSSGSASRGDIRIGMRNVDGSGGTLAFASFPGGGVGGNIIFDEDENWRAGPSDRILRNTIFHESGHSIGIQHVCPAVGGKLMEPFIDLSYLGPRHDDIRAGHRQHGDSFENNNSSGAAFDIGTVDLATPLAPWVITGATAAVPPFGSLMSIDANGEEDWYEFEVLDGDELTIDVSPIGLSYGDDTQHFTGACNSGAVTNSKLQADLSLQLYASNGATLLASSTSGGLGDDENIVDFSVSPGTFFVRIFEAGSVSQPQLYSLDISVSETAPAPPVAGFSGTPLSGKLPLQVDFTDASTGSITSRDWDFGDTNTSMATNPSHTYTTAGRYTVMLDVTGPGGSDNETKVDYVEVLDGDFVNIGPGLAGAQPAPVYTGSGDLTPGSAIGYSTVCTGAQPFATGYLFLGVQQGAQNFKGGTLYAFPFIKIVTIPFNGAGNRTLTHAIDPGPGGFSIVVQYWFQDATGPIGFTASNGLRLDVP